MIVAAEELDIAVRQLARQIAGPVQPRSGLAANGLGDEPLRRQLRTVQIAARNTCSADVDLARDPDGTGSPCASSR